MEATDIDASIEAAWQADVEAEANRRLAARGLTLETQQDNGNQRRISNGRKLTPMF